MKVTHSDPAGFTLEFETEEELRAEHSTNLAHGALLIPTAESVAVDTSLNVTLRGPWGGVTRTRATIVAVLPDGIALGIDGDPERRLAELLWRPPSPPTAATPASPSPATDSASTEAEKKQTAWDRLRTLSQMEKILLAVKAEKPDRALLLQDNDPRVLLSLLRNPRLTVEEVSRLTRSSFLNYQIADVIMKTQLWMTNLDVRLGLVHNPKTPQPFALRILPTLPEPEIRSIARSGTFMALKQAALRLLQRT